MRSPKTLVTSLAALMLSASAALACHVEGLVVCDANGQPIQGIRIDLVATDGTDYARYGGSNEFGHYEIALLCEPHCYRITAQLPNGETLVSPASGSYEFCANETNGYAFTREWRLNAAGCPTVQDEGACWLTAGGVKFRAPGKEHNWGGNVYPGCDPDPGHGGQWNDVDALRNLHFQGWNIRVVRCGNIAGIKPGSESPVTPYNFIEFEGTGTLKGVAGNKADYGDVYFWAHVEDREEPGSRGQRNLIDKDRYFLNVFTNPADPIGSSVFLVDEDGNPATMDPIVITGGNMQLHASSCSSPVAAAGLTLDLGDARPAMAFLGAPAPNPVTARTTLRFGVPKATNVSLRIFDAAGRLVRDLHNGAMGAGEYTSTWDLSDNDGGRVARGVYFARLAVGTEVVSRSVIVGR